jgi:hypothetical protein
LADDLDFGIVFEKLNGAFARERLVIDH